MACSAPRITGPLAHCGALSSICLQCDAAGVSPERDCRLDCRHTTASWASEDNVYLFLGYRKTDVPLWRLVQTAFQWHNETFNIWSHLVPSAWFLLQTVRVLRDRRRPMWIQKTPAFVAAAGGYLFAVSAGAHLACGPHLSRRAPARLAATSAPARPRAAPLVLRPTLLTSTPRSSDCCPQVFPHSKRTMDVCFACDKASIAVFFWSCSVASTLFYFRAGVRAQRFASSAPLRTLAMAFNAASCAGASYGIAMSSLGWKMSNAQVVALLSSQCVGGLLPAILELLQTSDGILRSLILKYALLSIGWGSASWRSRSTPPKACDTIRRPP